MIRFNRIYKIEKFRECVAERLENGNKDWHISIDLKNGDIVITDYTPKRERYHKILNFRIPEEYIIKKDSARIYAVIIRKAIREYEDTFVMCQSRAKDTFKNEDISKGFIGEVPNPHYKCAAPMKLYDANVIKYNKKYETTQTHTRR